MGSAEFQGKIWGARARDWADFGEGTSYELFEAILKKHKITNNSRFLDIGCGAGSFCRMVSGLGAKTSGIDASEELILIAKQRLPGADFRQGEMEELPYPDNSFDIVAGINSFQFAGDIVSALKEAKRTAKEGGEIIMAVWGRPEECEAAKIFQALGPFMPPPEKKPSGRPPLFTDGVIESLALDAGLKPLKAEKIKCKWKFPDENSFLRAMLSAGNFSIAMQHHGEEPVKNAVKESLDQFKNSNGSYELSNTFLYLASKN